MPRAQGVISIKDILGIPLEQVKTLIYRGADYPGSFIATTKSGEKHILPAQQGLRSQIQSMFRPYRCITCFDWSAELSDISLGDVYTEDPEHRSVSAVIVRNQKGSDILLRASSAGRIYLEPVAGIPMAQNRGYRQKKYGNRVFIQNARQHGLPTPTYPEIP